MNDTPRNIQPAPRDGANGDGQLAPGLFLLHPRSAAERSARALAAVQHLSARDARLAALIAHIGPHRPNITADPFNALALSILQQQVSMKAAASIARRLRALCPRGRLRPAAILAIHPRKLRAVGLSRQKAEYVRILSGAFESGELATRRLRRMPDDEVIELVTRLKGIGRWTAEMLLIFCLERPDVWPIDDLGLKKAVQRLAGRDAFLGVEEIRALAEPWRPYRSYATWYLWRSLEGAQMPGMKV